MIKFWYPIVDKMHSTSRNQDKTGQWQDNNEEFVFFRKSSEVRLELEPIYVVDSSIVAYEEPRLSATRGVDTPTHSVNIEAIEAIENPSTMKKALQRVESDTKAHDTPKHPARGRISKQMRRYSYHEENQRLEFLIEQKLNKQGKRRDNAL